MTIVVVPLSATVAEAIAFLESRGCKAFYLWRGPDGMIRGHGTKDVPAS